MNAKSNLAPEIDWNALYAEQLPRVYNYFRYRVGDDVVAEDLTTATFEKAWRSRGRFRRDRAAFSTWLFTIARNVAIDHYRRHRPTVSIEAIEQQSGGLPQSEEASPEETIVQVHDLARLGTLLAHLPPREQELVALKYGAGFANRAIAKMTQLSESNVGTILHRVVQKLRARWEAKDK
ncbi:MAG: sigma-70 family RNA polymerase sigma factor [Anaerolineae bacterium]|nr:sigma-70 family RNA polymerase sigma factor [Anaerolineae bacterium]